MTLLDGELILERSATLKQAWMIYTDGHAGNRVVDVVCHRVREVRGEAILAEGFPLSRAGVLSALRGLLPRATPSLLSERILVAGEDLLVFYRPPGAAKLNFSTSSDALSRLSGEWLPQPGLIFAVQRSPKAPCVALFAYSGAGRPGAECVLYRAPYPNMFANHQVCWGSSLTPDGITPDLAGQWEAAFLGSAFTHTTSRTHRFRGSNAELWNTALAQGRFPPRALLPVLGANHQEVTLQTWLHHITTAS